MNERGVLMMRWLTTLGAAAIAALVTLAPASAGAQESVPSARSVSLTSDRAALEVELADGDVRLIELRDGELEIDGSAAGTYETGGQLESAWRELLRSPGLLGETELASSVQDWLDSAPEWAGADQSAGTQLSQTLAEMLRGADAQVADAADAAGVAESASVLGAGGKPLTIAPGLLDLEALTLNLDQLRGALGRLDLDAEAANENLALLIHDDYQISAGQTIQGNLALLDGDLSLDGTVRGDVLVLNGNLELMPNAVIEGDLVTVGGEVEHMGGAVMGEMLALSLGDDFAANFDVTPLTDELRAEADEMRAEARALRDELRHDLRAYERDRAPRGFFGRVGHNIGHAVGGIFAAVIWFLVLSAMGFGVVYFSRKRLETIADVVRTDFGRSFGVGLGGQLLSLPILLVLVVGIVTWLAIPFYLLAIALSIPLAYLAAAHAAGEFLYNRDVDALRRFRPERPNSFYYVISGLAALIAPFAVASALHLLGGVGPFRGLIIFAASVATWVAFTGGFGAIILTRAGQRPVAPQGYDFDADDSFDAAKTGGSSA
ncbi:MAG: hypothetical protein ABFS14_02080 [Gemmatimonadota bacterium]